MTFHYDHYPLTLDAVHRYKVDTKAMEVRLPQDKLDKAQSEIRSLAPRKKDTLHDIHPVISCLNFACAVVPMGRVFLRRLISRLVFVVGVPEIP